MRHHVISRSSLRLASALVMLSFVICHLTAHAFLLVSLDTAGNVLDVLMFPWRTVAGTVLLTTAFVVHFSNALWSIYIRRSLRLIRWEWAQLLLGLCIPAILIPHVTATGIAASAFDVTVYYNAVLLSQWMFAPWLGVLQVLAVLTVWTHASIGIHFWLRTKVWYPAWRVWLFGFALLLPTLALAGYVSAGNEVLRAATDPDYVREAFEDANVTQAAIDGLHRIEHAGWGIYVALLALPFAARGVRAWYHRRRRPPQLTHASGRKVPILPGATVLETLREHGIAHASVCGGRARCTTCRILVTKGLEKLPPPAGPEAAALKRIAGTPGLRLACQVRPSADIAIMPLLAADATADDGTVPGGLEGRERPITVMFVDIRGSTTIGEAKLPYDVLFILNQFHQEMTKALAATNGHYSQFTGDGLMALYGLHEDDPAAGAADALRGAREMFAALDQLNYRLRNDLKEPLRIGIGIHLGVAIVGAMGPPRSQIITALGDTVNTCARLESLTKEYDCVLVVSRPAAEAAALDVEGCVLHEAAVKGRVEPVEFYTLQWPANMPA